MIRHVLHEVEFVILVSLQGPLGWHSSADAKPAVEGLPLRESTYINTKKNALFNGVSWEASIDKNIKEELYSSLEVCLSCFLCDCHHCYHSLSIHLFSSS